MYRLDVRRCSCQTSNNPSSTYCCVPRRRLAPRTAPDSPSGDDSADRTDAIIESVICIRGARPVQPFTTSAMPAMSVYRILDFLNSSCWCTGFPPRTNMSRAHTSPVTINTLRRLIFCYARGAPQWRRSTLLKRRVKLWNRWRRQWVLN